MNILAVYVCCKNSYFSLFFELLYKNNAYFCMQILVWYFTVFR